MLWTGVTAMADAAVESDLGSDPGIIAHKKWKGFLVLGLALFIGGACSVAVPAVSTFASSVVFGIILIAVGIVKIIQSLQVKNWTGFVWQELTGLVELIGGFMVYFNPLKGAMAITLLIASVIFIQGVLQIALSLKVRKAQGWYWFAVSGVVAFCASAGILLKLPLTIGLPAGSIAGIALMIAGIAYIAIALSIRRAKAPAAHEGVSPKPR